MAMRRSLSLLLLACSALSLTVCNGGDDDNSSDGDAGQDSGADGDVDADADTDTDTDTDTDADADSDSDVDVDAGTPDYTAIWVSAGGFHTCAVLEGGDVKCWGGDTFGALGYGTDLDDDTDADTSLPSTLPFVRVGGPVSGISAGGYHTCAMMEDGNAKCWGYNLYLQLGVWTDEYGSPIGVGDVPADHDPINFGDAAATGITAAPGNFTCALLNTGDIRCFGDNTNLWMGNSGFEEPVEDFCTGSAHICALLESGAVYCWGQGASGALGYGDTDGVYSPFDLGPVDIGGTAVQVACGYYHTCALLDTGDVVCWGANNAGQLGYGNTDEIGDDEVPADIGPVNVGASVLQVSAGDFNTCAIIEGGGVKCWGSGGGVPLGYGNTDSVGMTNVPADVGNIDLGGPAVLVSNGYSHICALLENGGVMCWGAGGYGLGHGDYYVDEDIGDDETPASVGYVPLL